MSPVYICAELAWPALGALRLQMHTNQITTATNTTTAALTETAIVIVSEPSEEDWGGTDEPRLSSKVTMKTGSLVMLTSATARTWAARTAEPIDVLSCSNATETFIESGNSARMITFTDAACTVAVMASALSPRSAAVAFVMRARRSSEKEDTSPSATSSTRSTCTMRGAEGGKGAEGGWGEGEGGGKDGGDGGSHGNGGGVTGTGGGL